MERYKKMKEWNVIKNLLPTINKHLQLSIQDYDDKYSRESPDFVFSNESKSIGIEIVECHPSVNTSKKNNAPERVNYEKRYVMNSRKMIFCYRVQKMKN